ncbi:hypothetical protein MRX96_038475 [Rhipicephalus microplus]
MNSSLTNLQVTLDDLQDKDTTLEDLNKRMADLIFDDAEYDKELAAAFQYHDKATLRLCQCSQSPVVLQRVIRAIKEAFKRCLGRSSLRYNELLTVLVEVEVAVHCRPLTYLEGDISSTEALTQSHFLVGKRLVTLPTERKILALNATMSDLRRRAWYQEQLIRNL